MLTTNQKRNKLSAKNLSQGLTIQTSKSYLTPQKKTEQENSVSDPVEILEIEGHNSLDFFHTKDGSGSYDLFELNEQTATPTFNLENCD